MFCLDVQADIFKPHEKHHSTVKDACQVATGLMTKKVILLHAEDDTVLEGRRPYTSEGEKYFAGNLFMPDDRDVIQLSWPVGPLQPLALSGYRLVAA
jgi:ribonuclease Z